MQSIEHNWRQTKDTIIINFGFKFDKEEVKLENNNLKVKEMTIYLKNKICFYEVDENTNEIILKKHKKETWKELERQMHVEIITSSDIENEIEEEKKNQSFENFLKDVYANSSIEKQKSMERSFLESGGKNLSTEYFTEKKHKNEK